MNTNLKAVLGQLKSDKSKERQQGVASLRQVFDRDSVVNGLDENGDGRAWLVVFQALFTAAVNDRTVVVKKGLSGAAAVSLRRLEETASAVRWLTERSVTRLNTKVVKSLINHLLQTIVYHGQLLTPIALDYAKALRVIVSYRPHLDHLDTELWIKIITLAFAVVLEDDLSSNLGDVSEHESEEAEVDAELSESNDGSSRKRRRNGSNAPGPSKRTRTSPKAVSLEQIEFTALIAILLQGYAPLLSSEYPLLARAVLTRLHRFLEMYPPDTSAHFDAIVAINSALNHLALNSRDAVTEFGTGVWNSLLSLWNTKNKQMKEGVLMAFIRLLPYVTTAEAEAPFDRPDAIGKLFRVLLAEQESRWGLDQLSLDSLRLELNPDDVPQPFVAQTFRYGFNFDASQAVAWAVLELISDCVKELYQLSDSAHTLHPTPSHTEGKRARPENPVAVLLRSVQLNVSSSARVYYLQCLLFSIERHWSAFRAEIQQELINTLLQLLTVDDTTVQSWIFCCIAAVAHADRDRTDLQTSWDGVWSHTIRRTSAAGVCRTACHAAHVLLSCGTLPIPRVLAEIETIMLDLSVQGPSSAFDSVCAFFVKCLQVAGQDVRLYRMQLEDKVLGWLTENWTASSSTDRVSRARLDQHSVQDVLSLLECICGLSERSNLLCVIFLPEHSVVELIQERYDTASIREFLLEGRLSVRRPKARHSRRHTQTGVSPGDVTNLLQPAGRERKASAFLLKAMESELTLWESRQESASRPSTESLRRALDLAILTIAFESSLVVNGIRSTRRALSAACRLVTMLSMFLRSSGLSSEDLMLLSGIYVPLTVYDMSCFSRNTWDAFLEPGPSTGIKERSRGIALDVEAKLSETLARKRFLRTVWASSDVQDALLTTIEAFRHILRAMATEKLVGRETKAKAMDVDDDRDDFAPIRTSESATISASLSKSDLAKEYAARVAANIIPVLSLAHFHQTNEEEPPRDKFLTEFVCECADDSFVALFEPFISQVQAGHIHISSATLDKLLKRLEPLLMAYKYSHSESIQMLVIRLLSATTHVWLLRPVAGTEIGQNVIELYDWLSGLLKSKKMSWRTRDTLVRFYDHYLALDPQQVFWMGSHAEVEGDDIRDGSPDQLLLVAAEDEDIRVRFSVALSTARLFSGAYIAHRDPMLVYSNVREHLCIVLSNYEYMLTRFVCLGNIMITSSAVRRGPYWHLLETCLHSQMYVRHIETVLTNAASIMGLAKASDLFQSYASQIAYSIRQSQQDFFLFPPHLLGYHDRRECAEETFLAFSPNNLLADHSIQDREHGKDSFARHCRMIGITPIDGLLRCFADIVGYQIVFWIDENCPNAPLGQSLTDDQSDELSSVLHERFAILGNTEHLAGLMEKNVDRIVVAILRTNGDMNHSQDETIAAALGALEGSERMVRAFRALMRFRRNDEFQTHPPNLPSFPIDVVLRAISWVARQVKTTNSQGTSYHVMHQVFGDIARSPLINEQLRLITCLCVWISLNYSHFKNTTLLRVLMNGALILLTEPHLATCSQGILDWAFIHLKEIQCDTTRIVEFLIRTGSITRGLSLYENASTRELGLQMMEWAEAQVLQFSNVESMRRHFGGVLSAWPFELKGPLADLASALTATEISDILADPRVSSHKFKTVRRLAELSGDALYGGDQFSRYDFWMLKDCIPSSQPVDQDMDSFADLLLCSAGRIRSQAIDRQSQHSIGSRHQRLYNARDDKGRRNARPSPKRPIVMALFDMLSEPSSRVVRVAYETLRMIASIDALDTPEYGTWSSEYRGDVAFVRFCPLQAVIRAPQDLSKLRQHEYLDAGTDFTRWIALVNVLLCDYLSSTDLFYSHLTRMLVENEAFAEQMLPVLVHNLLQADNASSGESRQLLSAYLTELLTRDSTDVACLRAIVNTVLHLRHYACEGSQDPLAYNRWLEVDFLLLSQRAITCGAYTTALLFLELSAEYRSKEDKSMLEREQILFNIYSHVDEPDGFYGIQSSDLRKFLLRRFQHEKQWGKAFHFFGANYEAEESTLEPVNGILESLHSFGFNKLAMTTAQSLAASSDSSSSDMNYRLGWRTETWDLPALAESANPEAGLYTALRAVHRERDVLVIDSTVTSSLARDLQHLRQLGNENLTGIRVVTRNLMCISQIRRWRSKPIQTALLQSAVNLDEREWTDFCHLHSDLEFDDLESIVATRISLIRSLRYHNQRDQPGSGPSDLSHSLIELEKRCLVDLSAAAQEALQPQIALNSVVRAQRLEEKPSFLVSQEFAKVLWLHGEQKHAYEFLRSELDQRSGLGKPKSDADDMSERALCLARLGEWASEASLEKPEFILAHYFSPASEMIEQALQLSKSKKSQPIDRDRAVIFHKFALFADQQYHTILRSPDITRLKVYSERKRKELEERSESIRRTQSGSSKWAELTQHQRRAKALYEQDTAQFLEVTTARDAYLNQALKMLSLCLEASDDYDDDSAIRLCSLWFSNFTNDVLAPTLSDAVERVPSRKFVFLAHQLSARLSGSEQTKLSHSQQTLQSLLLRMCSEHPFHSLYQVYSLRPANHAHSNRRHSGRLDMETNSQIERSTAALEMFDRLRSHENRSDTINSVELLCNTYLEWAKFPIKKDPALNDKRRKKEALPIPSQLAITKISNIRVPVTTAKTPIDPTMRYIDCVWIKGYGTQFDTAGGVNLPKISYCHGSDGQIYKQLFKGEGEDDLRQDAVMEQVFELCNKVLCRDRETRKRELRIRSYTVVPLAAQAGLLEFVVNTIPMQAWLVYAHPKYRPKDMTYRDGTNLLVQTRKDYGGDKAALVDMFTKIRSRFKPVLRHFFTERYRAPLAWFETRLRYSRSVATTSIVGHVLGLGDRHISNILLDNVTGEVVHIDLGIAFEQGKLLPVPERVPFRLTADMVDGFGITGTEGVFRRCAEETLRVLRNGSDVVNTVLEVFKYDPLHSWTASAVKFRRAQAETNQIPHESDRLGIGIDMDSGTEDEAADRALHGVARKLDKSLSVEYTVNELISEATDVTNLALMFAGWSPHC